MLSLLSMLCAKFFYAQKRLMNRYKYLKRIVQIVQDLENGHKCKLLPRKWQFAEWQHWKEMSKGLRKYCQWVSRYGLGSEQCHHSSHLNLSVLINFIMRTFLSINEGVILRLCLHAFFIRRRSSWDVHVDSQWAYHTNMISKHIISYKLCHFFNSWISVKGVFLPSFYGLQTVLGLLSDRMRSVQIIQGTQSNY